jgi:lysophospholipase L1-like esterase
MTQFDPDVIVLALGTNNASQMPGSKDAFLSYYRSMLGDMHKRFPEAKIIMTTALYRWDSAQRTEQVEKYIIPLQKQLADEYDYVTLYDAYTEYKPYGTTQYYKDKLHPNNLGYQKLAETMKKGVDQILNAQ